jgi:hypothetical protein
MLAVPDCTCPPLGKLLVAGQVATTHAGDVRVAGEAAWLPPAGPACAKAPMLGATAVDMIRRIDTPSR